MRHANRSGRQNVEAARVGGPGVRGSATLDVRRHDPHAADLWPVGVDVIYTDV
jgi:hypothetical protein